MRTRRTITGALATMALTLAACGGDDDGGATAEGDTTTTTTAASSGGGGGGGGGGVLQLGDESIELASSLCYLEEQDAAAGGGKILFVAQGQGIDAQGEEVRLDVSRYDEDSQFAGDSILVDIGDVFSGDSVGWDGGAELGTVDVDGSTVSADGLTFVNFDDMEERSGSFEIRC